MGQPMLLSVLLALTVIIVTARLMGVLFSKLDQPAVIGEVIGGILLGPSVLGTSGAGPAGDGCCRPTRRRSSACIAQLGVILYMFLVGLELDLTLLRSTVRVTVAISLRQHHRAVRARRWVIGGDVRAARARGRAVFIFHAVRRRVDVDHRVPGARAHPAGPRTAGDALGTMALDLRGDQRRDRLVPAGVRGQRDAIDAGRRDSHRGADGRLHRRDADDRPRAGHADRDRLDAAPHLGERARAGAGRGVAVGGRHRVHRHPRDLRRLPVRRDPAAPQQGGRARDRRASTTWCG